MITLYDFHGMNMQEKADAIWQGQFIGSRIDGEITVQLYNLGSFYAEVFYNAKSNEIKKIRAFRTTQLIEPYLSNIKLSL